MKLENLNESEINNINGGLFYEIGYAIGWTAGQIVDGIDWIFEQTV